MVHYRLGDDCREEKREGRGKERREEWRGEEREENTERKRTAYGKGGEGAPLLEVWRE